MLPPLGADGVGVLAAAISVFFSSVFVSVVVAGVGVSVGDATAAEVWLELTAAVLLAVLGADGAGEAGGA